MDWIDAAILGVVEGITEYLPISSTGHLIITQNLLGLADDPETKRAADAFNIVIQGGAILAVLGLYFERVWSMLKGALGKDQAGFRLLVNIGIAFLPAAVLGVLLDEMIEEQLFHAGPVVLALALGGVYMIALEWWRKGRIGGVRGRMRSSLGEKGLEDLTAMDALVIGLLQCVAMWPGTSRSMMTITGGVLRGLRPAAAAEFSFLLGLPTLGGACVYKLAKDLMRAGEIDENGEVTRNMFEVLGWGNVVVGMLFATVSAAIAVKWLVGFLKKHGLEGFGYYRLLLALAMAGLILGGHVAVSS